MNEDIKTHKTLRMYYTAKEIAVMMDMSYNTFRRELRRNSVLSQKLPELGWSNYKRLTKMHVLEIFKVLGFPDGYEWYER